ncbi:hypothetical protein M0C34_07615 [Agarivorans sp. TSD2052]|uniref:hypothetical protein n=1 Tax=Agarivorans sp. TSD2052 TaxID=2937286 RepID=UPI00200C4010|nr:hypothetical protein [Agarivorans sp. TSD2052]UPW20119.1 hypothetical protein M0C34_07615 [Agarivorans sp. TSD2052]
MLFTGFFAVSLVFGYLIGASNSPVVGAFLTAAIGLAGAVFGGKYFIDTEDKQAFKGYVGSALAIIAVGIFLGEIAGEAFRYNWRFAAEKSFPWKNSEPPQSTYEALDWLSVQERLSELGYSNNQVFQLYSLRNSERKQLETLRNQQQDGGMDSFEVTEIYDKNDPFYKRLNIDSGTPNQRKGRGPASE